MSRITYRIYISLLVSIVFLALIALIYNGISYYKTNLGERFYHPEHDLLKPSGIMGHGLGILGTLFILTGVVSYMARKRLRSMYRMGRLKHWLEFHIFLCTLGPLLVLFHTSFKFGGLVAVSFWSMVAVFLSGIIGRFIYLQIPRTIEGRELSLNEVREMKNEITAVIRRSSGINEEVLKIIPASAEIKFKYHSNILVRYFKNYLNDRQLVRSVRNTLKKSGLPAAGNRKFLSLIKEDIRLTRKIESLSTMQNIFRYWHVVHLPFALVMFIIMLIHIAVTIVFGYRWIF